MFQAIRARRLGLLCSAFSVFAAIACGNSPSDSGADAGFAGSASSAGAPSAGAGTSGSASMVGGASGVPIGGATAGSSAASGSTTGGAQVGGATTGGGGAGGGTTAGTGNSGSSGGGSAGSGGSSPTGEPVFHIFMLMGQSNMAGVAPFEASDKNTDERLKVWGGCNQKAGQWNVANPPLSDCPGGSGINLSTSVDPGIWFGKTLLKKLRTGDTIGLIGTAESGEKIETFITGGKHHNAIMTKIAAVKTQKNVRFEGVIFHQGESNNTQGTWPALVKQLYTEVKQAFGVSYDVPFILGELPAGGCCSAHNTRVHEAAALLPMGAYVTQDGTKVMDQYHFDHASVVLMGTRYGDKMIEMLKW
jgi:hypothetical protein